MSTASDISSMADVETPATIAASAKAPSRLADFYELTKPRMNFLVVITTMVGFCMAWRTGPMNLLLLLHTVVGTALTAACAAVLNQVIEREQDAKMPRTMSPCTSVSRKSRPLYR